MAAKSKQSGRKNAAHYEFFTIGELTQKLESMGREYGASHPDDYYALVYVPKMEVIEAGPDYTRLHDTLRQITD